MRASPLALLLLVACEAPEGPSSPSGAGATEPSDSAVRPAVAEAPDGVTLAEHPCGADGASALAGDGTGDLWLGCRSATGLWRSSDAGETWAAGVTDPPGRFADVVVAHLASSPDGRLHVVGEDPDRGGLVVSVDPDGWTDDVLIGSATFAPGLFARAGTELAAAATMDGRDLAWRFDDGAAFAASETWGPRAARLNDLVAWDDRFYGVGSAPAWSGEPPAVFLDPAAGQRAVLGFRLDAEILGDLAARGELLDVDVDAGGLVAAGVDAERGCGLVVATGPRPEDPTSWRTFDLGVAFAHEATALEGACRDHGVVVAVGARGEDGLALVSLDGGRAWADLTPADLALPRLQRCEVLDGAVVVAGADGIVARLELAAP